MRSAEEPKPRYLRSSPTQSTCILKVRNATCCGEAESAQPDRHGEHSEHTGNRTPRRQATGWSDTQHRHARSEQADERESEPGGIDRAVEDLDDAGGFAQATERAGGASVDRVFAEPAAGGMEVKVRSSAPTVSVR